MKVLLTGSTGFLGKVILKNLLAKFDTVKTVGRRPGDDYAYDFESDLPFSGTLSADLIIHCAGKAHSVPGNFLEEQSFFKVNTLGTKHFLNALDNDSGKPKYFVFISSASVYGRETGTMINENCELAAKDAYGLSKIRAEYLIEDWCRKNDVICTILRLPLVAGLNPPGNLKAMISGLVNGYYFNIGGGKARKSIVMAEDVADAIVKAAVVGGIYNLTDNHNPTFLELSEVIAGQLGKKPPLSIPLWLAIAMAKFGDLLGANAPINSNKFRKITADLTFDCNKAIRNFNWAPKSVLKDFKIYINECQHR